MTEWKRIEGRNKNVALSKMRSLTWLAAAPGGITVFSSERDVCREHKLCSNACTTVTEDKSKRIPLTRQNTASTARSLTKAFQLSF